MSEIATATASGVPLARRPLILAACMAATFMAAVEATIIATAMPAIAARLGGFSLYAWVFSAYMLGQAVTIPIYGRLADLYGRRRVFYAGAAIFLLGSTLCGLAGSMAQLVVFRAIQGLGAGGVQPIANTIVGDIYSPVERARVQGMLSGVFGVSAVIGPSLGAFIVQYGAWPLVFWMNLPIGAAAIAMIALFLPEPASARRRSIDIPGSVLLLAAVTSLMLLLQSAGFDRAVTLALGVAFLLSGLALAYLLKLDGQFDKAEQQRQEALTADRLGLEDEIRRDVNRQPSRPRVQTPYNNPSGGVTWLNSTNTTPLPASVT